MAKKKSTAKNKSAKRTTVKKKAVKKSPIKKTVKKKAGKQSSSHARHMKHRKKIGNIVKKKKTTAKKVQTIPKSKRPKVGIFSLTSCSGCQMKILDLEKELLDIVGCVDIIGFPIAKAKNEEGPFDVAFVEGAVITKENRKELEKIRKQTKYLVAIGACATHAGIPYMKHFLEKEDLAGIMCPIVMEGASEPEPLDCVVEVDLHLTGCPVDKHEFVDALKQLLLGKIPEEYTMPVCIECKEKDNICLLNVGGKECIGPITNGGCGALCPSHSIPCSGCKGPTEKGR